MTSGQGLEIAREGNLRNQELSYLTADIKPIHGLEVTFDEK